ncbi:hypothetical protein WDW86_08500 [Bdellovibrionota bacterium FG-2]
MTSTTVSRLGFLSLCMVAVAGAGAGCAKAKAIVAMSSDELRTGAATALEDAAESLGEESTYSSSSALNVLSELAPHAAALTTTGGLDVSRTCTAGAAGAVTVAETWSGTMTKSVVRPKATLASSLTVTGTQSRVWTPPTGQTLACTANNRAQVRWANDNVVSGLSLKVTTDRTRTRTVDLKTSKQTVSRAVQGVVKGARTITWAVGTKTATTLARTKTISSSVTRDVTTTTSGVAETLSYTVATKTGEDLNVEVTRLIADGSWVSKKVVSGTVVLTKPDGTRIENTFKDLLFESAQDDPCLATSGSITGAVYASGATAASKTYVITFGQDTDSGISITEDGGTAVDAPEIVIQGCDLSVEG